MIAKSSRRDVEDEARLIRTVRATLATVATLQWPNDCPTCAQPMAFVSRLPDASDTRRVCPAGHVVTAADCARWKPDYARAGRATQPATINCPHGTADFSQSLESQPPQ